MRSNEESPKGTDSRWWRGVVVAVSIADRSWLVGRGAKCVRRIKNGSRSVGSFLGHFSLPIQLQPPTDQVSRNRESDESVVVSLVYNSP